MKIIINNILPPKGFKCINLFGILFCRKQLNKIDINHETIHTKQMQELLYKIKHPVEIPYSEVTLDSILKLCEKNMKWIVNYGK